MTDRGIIDLTNDDDDNDDNHDHDEHDHDEHDHDEHDHDHDSRAFVRSMAPSPEEVQGECDEETTFVSERQKS
jgi:ABC-type Zn2+ transport system substrate-binding protein/surface adhesin